MTAIQVPGGIDTGEVKQILNINDSQAGSSSKTITISSDSVLAALYAESVSGTLTVNIYTFGLNINERSLVISFPVLTAGTTELLLEKAAVSLDNLLIEADWSDACEFNLRIKGISIGETSTRLLSPSTGQATSAVITSTPSLLLGPAAGDRAGIIVKNFSSTDTLFIGYNLSEVTAPAGYPLSPGESLGIDLASGAVLYARSGGGSIDVRIMEASA